MQAEGGYTAARGKTKPKRGTPPPATRRVARGQTKPQDYDLEEYVREVGKEDYLRGRFRRDLVDIGLMPETDDAGIRRPLRAERIDGDPGPRMPNTRNYYPESDPDLEGVRWGWSGGSEAEDLWEDDVRRLLRERQYQPGPWDWNANLDAPREPDEPAEGDLVDRLRRLMLDHRDIEVNDNLLGLLKDLPNFNILPAFGDLLQSPGFKAGLGGTAALGALLSYFGANLAEEVLP